MLASGSTGNTGSKSVLAEWDEANRDRDAIFKFQKILKQILKILGNMPLASKIWSCVNPKA